MLVYPLMFLVFAGAMWLIFAPSSGGEEKEEQQGFNIDVPLPKEKGLLDDKKEAYERDAFEKQQKSKMGTLQDFEIAIGRRRKPLSGIQWKNCRRNLHYARVIRRSVLRRLLIRI